MLLILIIPVHHVVTLSLTDCYITLQVLGLLITYFLIVVQFSYATVGSSSSDSVNCSCAC